MIGKGGASFEADAELRATLTRILQSKPYAVWAAAFEAADVPFAPARPTEEGLNDPQVLHNHMVMTLDDPHVGPLTQMGVPIQLSKTPGRVAGPRASALLDAKDLRVSPLPSEEPRASDPTDPPPLAGVRILEITNLIAGPTAGRILADLGADVIKLEPPGGDMSRPIARTYFYCVNFNKRSVCIDTQTDAGKRIVQRLAASADALIANLRPRATERMGVGPAVNPRLIETHMTGYGWTGPYAKRPGIDPLAQALMGLSRAQGGPDNPPVFPAQLAPTDYTNGAMGALGTILALFARARSGVVQRVDSDLLSGGIVLSSAWFTRYAGKPKRQLADKEQYELGRSTASTVCGTDGSTWSPKATRYAGPCARSLVSQCRNRLRCGRPRGGIPIQRPSPSSWLPSSHSARRTRRSRPYGLQACRAPRHRQVMLTFSSTMLTPLPTTWSRCASIPWPASCGSRGS